MSDRITRSKRNMPTESVEALVLASGRQTRSSMKSHLTQLGVQTAPKSRFVDFSSDGDEDMEGSRSPPRVSRSTRGQAVKRSGADNQDSQRAGKKSRFVDFGDEESSSPAQPEKQTDQKKQDVALSQHLFPPPSPATAAAAAHQEAADARALWFCEDLPESSQGSTVNSRARVANGVSSPSSQSSSSEEDMIPPTRPVSMDW